MQQPVIRITVFIQEFMRQTEHLLQRLLSQSTDIGTVDFILLICLPQMRRRGKDHSEALHHLQGEGEGPPEPNAFRADPRRD